MSQRSQVTCLMRLDDLGTTGGESGRGGGLDNLGGGVRGHLIGRVVERTGLSGMVIGSGEDGAESMSPPSPSLSIADKSRRGCLKRRGLGGRFSHSASGPVTFFIHLR